MSKVKVSVIVPVFNVGDYLSTSLDSILNQSLEDIEIICINDGSTDDSLKILENYAKKDNRIKIISKENEGQGTARNVGLDNACGEFISFVDADDFIKKDMLEKLYNKSVNGNLDLVMCKVSSFDNETHVIDDNLWYYSLKCFSGFKKEVFNNLDTKEFTSLISVTPYNKLYRRSFVEKNNIRFPEKYIFEDEVFFYNVYLKAKRISLIDENLYCYRTNRKGSTVSKGLDKDYSDIIHIFRLIRDLLVETNYINVYKKQVYNRFIHLILWRFSQTAPKYRKNFFNLMKKEFNEILNENSKDFSLNVDELDFKIKSRTLKVLNSKNLEEFEKLDSYKPFSVIMASYNNDKYLEDAIESLTVQNFGFEHNVELIIVDDGSSDDSLKIAKKYQEDYPYNIRVISKKNGGQASARNLGLEYAKGDYINFLDSDDKLSPNTFKAVYDFIMKNPAADVISIPITFFDNQKGSHILNYK
nr:glycosyltransferase family 2 protein [Methanobrevibacter smithii]